LGTDLLHSSESLFVIPIVGLDPISLPLFTQTTSANFCGHALLIKGLELAFIVHFDEFLAASGLQGVELHLKQLIASESPQKTAVSSYNQELSNLIETEKQLQTIYN
uniref:Uncharacterized protein n=1 Tax=Equus caballus TaxID=9796 RepID=A0A3Q2HQJ9_HORSE